MNTTVPQLSYREMGALFAVANETRDASAWPRAREAIQAVSGRARNRKTVAGLMQVAVQLLARSADQGAAPLTEEEAADIAAQAGYGMPPRRVHEIARWLAQWQGDQREARDQRERHLRQLAYFARALRDRATVPLPPLLLEVRRIPGALPLWMRTLSGGAPLDAVEDDVERDWASGPYDARTHPLFLALLDHLGAGHPLGPRLKDAEGALAAYWDAVEIAVSAAARGVRQEHPELGEADMRARAAWLLVSLQDERAPGEDPTRLGDVAAGLGSEAQWTAMGRLRTEEQSAVDAVRGALDLPGLLGVLRSHACSACAERAVVRTSRQRE